MNERLSVIEGKLAKLQAEFMAATQEKGRVESEVRLRHLILNIFKSVIFSNP